MIVSRSTFGSVLSHLLTVDRLSLDTETTGLRPYQGDRLFSLILADEAQAYYFNFQAYPDGDPETVLLGEHLEALGQLFSDPTKTFFLHNAKFDLHMLAQEGLFLAGEVHCTQAGARLERNEHFQYSLAHCAARIGLEKDEAVEEYIKAHKLYDKVQIPGKKTIKTDKHFDRVPLAIIAPYGERDAQVTYRLGKHQEAAFQALDPTHPPKLPTLVDLHAHQRKLTKVVFEIERVGVKIDRAYCKRAAQFETERAQGFAQEYRGLTGMEFKDSAKDFAKVFEAEKDKWGYTEKGNPSFDSDHLMLFTDPAARAVLGHRDAKSKADFYQGFLYHADSNDVVHPNLKDDGTDSGRFSSSEPNFQNLTSEDWGLCTACREPLESIVTACPKCGSDKIESPEFLVRRALIPRPGFVFIMPDYEQVEYRMMFDYACRAVGYETDIVKRIKQGYDPHQATADSVTAMGYPLTRSRAKNGNFAYLYGSGIATLAATIGATENEARQLKQAIAKSAPEVDRFVAGVIRTAKVRGKIYNWAGRVSHFPDPNFAYKAPNYLIQSGCADVMKIAMTQCDTMLRARGAKSRMVLTVHDELLVECHESELDWVPQAVKDVLESIFPWRYLPLTASMEWSEKSFADKRKGFPRAS